MEKCYCCGLQISGSGHANWGFQKLSYKIVTFPSKECVKAPAIQFVFVSYGPCSNPIHSRNRRNTHRFQEYLHISSLKRMESHGIFKTTRFILVLVIVDHQFTPLAAIHKTHGKINWS